MRINFETKVDISVNEEVAEINKITAANMNEIKNAVNANLAGSDKVVELNGIGQLGDYRGMIISNKGAEGPSQWSIWAAKETPGEGYEAGLGSTFTFYVYETGRNVIVEVFTITGTDRIIMDGVEYINITGGTKGCLVELTAIAEGFWLVSKKIGTWTGQTP